MSKDMFRVERISSAPAHPLEITFNVEKRTRIFQPANAAEDPGSPQDVPASTIEAITGDETLAPHFRCEPIPTAVKPEGGPAAESAASAEGETETSASRARRAPRADR